MTQIYWNALVGGGLIGLAASAMLLFNGRVTGISGILGGALFWTRGEALWRWLFLGGMLLGGVILSISSPDALKNSLETQPWLLVIAGLLVGFGTRLGSGCTSGHGVCGISRLSPRSLVATLAFIAAGVLTVALARAMGVLS